MAQFEFGFHEIVNIVVFGTVVLVFYVFYQHLTMSVARWGEAPIRWSWVPFLGWAIEMGSRPIDLLVESGNLYGEIFGLILAGHRTFIINDPHSNNVIIKPIKELTWEEFHHSVLVNFFGVNEQMLNNSNIDENFTRKGFNLHLLG